MYELNSTHYSSGILREELGGGIGRRYEELGGDRRRRYEELGGDRRRI